MVDKILPPKQVGVDLLNQMVKMLENEEIDKDLLKLNRKRKMELKKELDKIAAEVDLSYSEDRVLGCIARCP